MSSSVAYDDGGTAFPLCDPDSINFVVEHYPGMSLRDWFAGQALVGLFSIEANPRVGRDAAPFNPTHVDDMARMAYELADAMLTQKREFNRRVQTLSKDIA